MGIGDTWLLLKQNDLIKKQNELLEKQQAEEARAKRVAFFGEEEVLKMEAREKAREYEILLPKDIQEMTEFQAGIRVFFILGFIALCVVAALK